ncbi:UbiA prenyltransferase family [Lentinula lateritia]|uniref:UbiA prenyltransferase family n=1 Tax=Lentinula lateritia TaxID=40482 RepID=A0ABQ8VL02_9AGAR|nr:UbiA prenyltransferase family [Lentinula lateritia]
MLTTIRDFLVTLQLFNQSDMKTIVLPVTVFSQALASHHSVSRFLLVVFWIWMHLLYFTVTNQTFGTSPEEDAVNKPNRPIPAKRISVDSAIILGWVLAPVDLALSLYAGAVPSGVAICVLTSIYCSGGGHSHWLSKNGCCAGFYALFEYGATQIADSSEKLNQNQLGAIIGSALIIFTTIHAQDFRDDEGDALLGRRTFTLSFPVFSRISMPFLLTAWSITLYLFSEANQFVLLALMALGAVTGVRFLTLKSAKDDRLSYLYYNIWLSMAHVGLSSLDLDKVAAWYQ